MSDSFGCGVVILIAIGLVWVMAQHHHKAEEAKSPQQRAAELKEKTDWNNHVPKLVATAPDGTELWQVKNDSDNNHPIYFSSHGASWSMIERHGKSSRTVEHQTPNE